MNPVYVKLFKKQNKLLLSTCILIHLAGVIWIFNKVLKRVVKQNVQFVIVPLGTLQQP